MTEILLEARNITRTFNEGKISTAVLKGISLAIHPARMTAVIGKSGSGKSTLLHILGTLDTPTAGEVLFEGVDLVKLPAAQKAAFRNQSLGFIYQFHHLLTDFSALENVMIPLLIGGMPRAQAKVRAGSYLERTGLGHRLNFRPAELSGGERQRVAIARALVHSPRLVLADEPTGNLDAENSAAVYDLFCRLVREDGAAVVMVTHDLKLASRCDVQYEIENGLIRERPC